MRIPCMRTLLLYIATAMAEMVGCYLSWMWLRQGSPIWLELLAQSEKTPEVRSRMQQTFVAFKKSK
jgi:Uncharacterised BCR, YnfA/UPF0060 family